MNFTKILTCIIALSYNIEHFMKKNLCKLKFPKISFFKRLLLILRHYLVWFGSFIQKTFLNFQRHKYYKPHLHMWTFYRSLFTFKDMWMNFMTYGRLGPSIIIIFHEKEFTKLKSVICISVHSVIVWTLIK